jgi:hypothetical protein
MIDFFHEASQVGFSINSVGGLILLFYIIIEFIDLIKKTF